MIYGVFCKSIFIKEKIRDYNIQEQYQDIFFKSINDQYTSGYVEDSLLNAYPIPR